MTFGYRSRMGNYVVPVVSARSAGAAGAVGQGLGQIGQVTARVAFRDQQMDEREREVDHQIAMREERRARDVMIADAAVRKARHDVETVEILAEARKSAPPGALGHTDAARKIITERSDEFLSTLPDDPEVRNRFAPTVASSAARAIISEQGWESQTRSRFLSESYDEYVNTRSSTLYSSPNEQAFSEMIVEGDAFIDGLDIDETTKAAMRKDLRERATRAQFGGLIEAGRQADVNALIDSGRFDGVLSDGDKSNWKTMVKAADRSASTQAKALANEREAMLLDTAKDFELRIERGENLPSLPEITELIGQMRAANLPEHRVTEFRHMVTDAIASEVFASQPTRQLERERAGLQQRIDVGSATREERRAAELIDAQLKHRTERNASELGKQWRSEDIAQQSAALDQAAAMPVSDRLRAGASVGGGFQLLSGIPKAQRDTALAGKAARKARPDHFLPQPTVAQSNRRDVMEGHLLDLMGDLANDDAPFFRDIADTALDIMAGYRVGAGNEEGWDRGDFFQAVQILYGQTRRADGALQGGIGTLGRFKVALPDWSTGPEFERFLTNRDWSDARYASGAAAQPRDIYRHYRPRFVGNEDGAAVYVFQGPDGLLLNDKEEAYTIKAMKAPR